MSEMKTSVPHCVGICNKSGEYACKAFDSILHKMKGEKKKSLPCSISRKNMRKSVHKHVLKI